MMLRLAALARRLHAGAPIRFALWLPAVWLAVSPLLFVPPRPDALLRGRPGRSYPVA